MDYYHSQNIQSPPIKNLTSSHSTTETGKSATTKKISSDIHLFLAQHEEEFEFRKPTTPNKKENNSTKPENLKTVSLQILPSERKSPKRHSKKDITVKKSSETEVERNKYAGGGYEKSPNPKMLSKPNLTSPAKKDKKSESKAEISPVKSPQKFSHSAHSQSSPSLIAVQNPFNSQHVNMNPFSQSIPVSHSGQVHFYQDSAFSSFPTMTREEVNRDLRTKLNII
jgi:hypothetical protein